MKYLLLGNLVLALYGCFMYSTVLQGVYLGVVITGICIEIKSGRFRW